MTTEQDFDWVQARFACSPLCEFQHIRRCIKRSIISWRECHGKLDPDSEDTIECVDAGAGFNVHRYPKPGRTAGIVFELNTENDRIEIRDYSANRTMKITLTLNDEGECLYKIDGEGEYLLWQVARKALEPMFF